MSYHQLEKRFGITAVQMGFITPGQLHEAMTIQLNEDLRSMEHRLIGQILLERGYINSARIREVLRQMGLPLRFCLFSDDISNSSQATCSGQESETPWPDITAQSA
jgi:hypothetical protein